MPSCGTILCRGGERMSLTEAKKRANAKYQAKTIASLACRVKKEQAEAFKAYCESAGKTSNAALKDFVLGCIGEQEPGMASEAPQEAPGRTTGTGGSLLTPKLSKRHRRPQRPRERLFRSLSSRRWRHRPSETNHPRRWVLTR